MASYALLSIHKYLEQNPDFEPRGLAEVFVPTKG